MTSGTELSMLWESVDPVAALAARFGFIDVDHAVAWLEETLLDGWAGRMNRCDRIVISGSKLLAWVSLDGQRVVARCSVDPTRFARLAEVDALVAWLHSKGIPVAAPIVAGDGRLRFERDGFSLGLCPLLRGDLLDAGDVAQVEAAGRMLATLHEVLPTYQAALGADRALPDQQLVHGDFRSANILYAEAGITAVLDFDEVTNRSRVADLAQAAVLLATRYHDWRPTSPQTRDVFVRAYSDVAPLTSVQRDELRSAVIAVMEHFGWT